MDIDTAIKHSKEIYRNCKNVGCAFEHGQLANWLQQLKELKVVLGEDYDLDRLRELIQADKEGRCTILPFKVGDTVYTNIATRYMRKKERPYPIKVCYIGLNEKSGYFNVVYKNDSMWQFRFEQIGKYVFLTYEEAEQELKEREVNE